MRCRFAAGIAALALPVATAALAGGPLQVSSRLSVERRVALPDGSVRMETVSAAHAAPGDRVTVTVAFRNTGTVPLADLVVANPVPRGLRFRAATSPRLELSADGTRFAPLSALTVPLAGGGVRPARPDDVVAVRWRPPAPLAARSSGQFSFQAAIP